MNPPKFSIAVPAFKQKFLKECITSILGQTVPDFELIILNDNSPENLEAIISQFTDPRIIYMKNEVGCGAYNVSNNWNECLKVASGEFFMCIGDDDRLLPDCLEKYLKLIQAYPECNIYHAGTQIINESSEVYTLQESRPIRESAYSMIWHRWFSSRKTYIGDFLFKTVTLKNSGGFLWFPYAWGSDEQTVYSIASNGGIANMQDYGFQYRVNRQTISYSRDNYKGKIEAHRLGKEWFIRFLKDEPSDSSDRLFWRMIKEGLDYHYSDLYRRILKDDFCYNQLRNLHYWRKKRRQYGLSGKDILFCFLLGVYKRLKESSLFL